MMPAQFLRVLVGAMFLILADLLLELMSQRRFGRKRVPRRLKTRKQKLINLPIVLEYQLFESCHLAKWVTIHDNTRPQCL